MGKISSFNSKILKILNKDRRSQDDSDLNDNTGTEDNASNPATSSTRFIKKPDPIDPKLGNGRLINDIINGKEVQRELGILGDSVKRQTRGRKIGEATIISKIAAKTGLQPNEIRNLYRNEAGKCDIDSLVKDFDNGKGVKNIQDKQEEFKKTGERASRESRGIENSIESSGPKSFVDRVLEERSASAKSIACRAA